MKMNEITNVQWQAMKNRTGRDRYHPEIREKMAVYANKHGVMEAVRKFSSEFGVAIPRTTIRDMRKAYQLRQNSANNPDYMA